MEIKEAWQKIFVLVEYGYDSICEDEDMTIYDEAIKLIREQLSKKDK